MRLLHKNLLFASALSFAVAGFLGSTSASALDEFSLSDIVSRQQKQMSSRLTSPLSTSADCESANPDSTISCNENTPSVLFNRIADGTKLYGHDGKGVIFTNADGLINGDSQKKIAKRGDRLSYSAEFYTERYRGTDDNEPITTYQLVLSLSQGLTIDEESIVVKVGDQAVSKDAYSLEIRSVNSGDMLFGVKDLVQIDLDWANYVQGDGWNHYTVESFKYDEGANIEVLYSATVDKNAPSKIKTNIAYSVKYLNSYGGINTDYSNESDITEGKYAATAMLDGNIVIRKTDASQNPIRGAKYAVNGVTARQSSGSDGVYIYDTTGAISEFETNERGEAIITNVPFGEYTISETYAPDGQDAPVKTVKKNLAEEWQELDIGNKRYVLNEFDTKAEVDMVDLGGGKKTVPGFLIDETMTLNYDPDERAYVYENLSVSEDEGSYAIKTKMNGQDVTLHSEGNIATLKVSDVYPTDVIAASYWLDIDESQIIAHLGVAITLTYDPTTDSYIGNYAEEGIDSIILKKDADGYQLQLYAEGGMPYTAAHFVYYESFDKYILDYDYMYLVVESVSDSEMVAHLRIAATYSAAFNRYYVGGAMGIFQLPIDIVSVEDMATIYPFSSIPTENILNPQTSDAILKSLAVIALSIAPIAIVRKQLSKR